MNRITASFELHSEDLQNIKLKLLNWSNQFSISVFLDSNQYQHFPNYQRFECLAAVKPIRSFTSTDNSSFLSSIKEHHSIYQDWLFGHLNYDFKNHLHHSLASNHLSHFNFPEGFFFCPETVCYIKTKEPVLTIETFQNPHTIFQQLLQQQISYHTAPLPSIKFEKRINQSNYYKKIEALRKHIKDGDCYEINFCNEGLANQVDINPLAVFQKLNELAPAPYAAFYKHQDQYLSCASPERFLYKAKDKIISQPIKGTARRSKDLKQDELYKLQLKNSRKDQAENVMIVDLTRNDLAQVCKVGSISVDELFGIYSFPSVHQMISTISGSLPTQISILDVLQHTFPMGSMTGAPKKKVMELIEQYECSKRELYSGTLGYITPSGDADFNVIIRSLFYNATTKYLSYHTGGAITYDSTAESEWEETALKAFNLETIFNS